MSLHRRRDLLGSSAALALLACGAGSRAAPAPVGFSAVAVHDPAVIRVDGEFYVFGSHLAVARSADLMHWTRLAQGVDDRNPVFGQRVRAELKDALDWAQTTTLWAPDVTRLADGRFGMYYCACKGDSPRSALGLAVADRVTGPYVNQRLLLKSGQWGRPSEDGSIYDATRHPNAVDPAVFADATGRPWMVYGSYAGGIFILALDAATGLPRAQGYGRHLTGGNHARIEGAYVLYSPESRYYYLFLSFGGLGAAGGYQVRVARSRRPDGPYVDGAGTDMATVKGAPGTFQDDVGIAPHGMKLMGGHQFAWAAGETGAAPGYVSPGHNSAFRDAASGQYFILFHTRFPGAGERHELRVHEMHLNEDGWPVIAPLRYAPLGLASPAQPAEVDAAQAAGSYQLVNHGKDITAAVKASVGVTLAADGTVGGGMSGTWQHRGGNKLTITSGGATYAGVLSRQWNAHASNFVVSLSALSGGGVSLWAIRTGA